MPALIPHPETGASVPSPRTRSVTGLGDQELRRYLPEGIDYPPDIPEDLFKHALKMYWSSHRVDMQALSSITGISRRTLYRRVQDRKALVRKIHWYNARTLLAKGLAASRALNGAQRLIAVYSDFMHTARGTQHSSQANTPRTDDSLEEITAKQRNVHSQLVQFVRRFLAIETQAGQFESDLPLDALAFAIVRMGESFLYSEVLTGESSDYRFSVEMISRLLRPASTPGSVPTAATRAPVVREKLAATEEV